MPSNTSQVEEPQSPVPPGNLTGLYYIILAGLPWNTSWQSLKDFARKPPDGTQIKIDHAMVFPGSTDGWVRIRGRREFHRALAHLTRGLLNNRAIIADGRNEEEWTMLRALNAKNSSQPPQSTASSHGHPEWLYMSPSSPVFWSMTQLPPPIQCVPFLPNHMVIPPQMSPRVSHAPVPAPAQIYSYQMSALQICQPQMSPVQMSNDKFHPNELPPAQMPPQSPTEPRWHWAPIPVIHTEAKKIIIKKLGPSFNEANLETLMREILPYRSFEHLDIHIARNSSQVPKGYAFVTFPSFETAQWAINAFNGLPLEGRILFAGFAKEGVVSKGAYMPRKGQQEPKSTKDYASSNCSFSSSSSTVVAPSVVSEDTNYTLCASPLQACAIDPPPRSAGTPMVVDGSSFPSESQMIEFLAV